MVGNIKVKGQPEIKYVGYQGGYLDVWPKSGFRRYQARAAIKKLERLHGTPNEITFRMEIIDGVAFTGLTTPSIFTDLERDFKQGSQPGDFLIIPNAKPPANHDRQLLVLLGIIGVVIVWFFTSGDATTPNTAVSQTPALSEFTAQVMAKTLCEMRVKDTLKAPSTADFPFFSQATFDGSRRATLSSYVDAQNGFGAMLRTNFVCTIEYGGGDTGARESWKIVDFVVLQ